MDKVVHILCFFYPIRLVIMWFSKLKPTNNESASAFIQPRLRQKERLGELQTLRNICFPGRRLYIHIWIFYPIYYKILFLHNFSLKLFKVTYKKEVIVGGQ